MKKFLKGLLIVVLIIVLIYLFAFGQFKNCFGLDGKVEATYINGKLIATEKLLVETDMDGHKSIVCSAYPENYIGWKNGEDYNIDITVEDISDELKTFEDELKATPSEIEGMTAYDKYVLGLNPYSEDTDGDGLSDADEIKLGTDGTQMSTAGDLYTDGYKYAHGMDLFTKNEEYTLTQEFSHNLHKEIILSANKPEDFAAKVEGCSTDKDELTYEIGLPVLEAYKLETFTCDVSIDVTDILKQYSQYDLTADDLVVFSAHAPRYMRNYSLEKLDIDVEGNIISIGNLNLSWNIDELDMEYDKDDKESLTQYMKEATTQGVRYIFVCSKFNLTDMNGTKLANYETKDLGTEAAENNDMVGFAHLCNIMTGFFGGKATVYYGDTGDETKNQKIIDDFTEELTWQAVDDAEHIIFIKMPIEDVISKYNNYKRFLGASESSTYEEVRNIGNSLFLSIFTFFSYDTIEPAYSENGVRTLEKNKKAAKKAAEEDAKVFHFEDETFVFHNLDTPYSEGVCAGIAVIVAKTHNRNYVSTTGYYKNINEFAEIKMPSDGMSWDISGEENKTFLDRYLSDYQDESFYEKVKNNYESLTTDEEEFVKMATCYLVLLNDIEREYSHNIVSNVKDMLKGELKRPYMANIDNVKKELDKGKVLICTVSGKVKMRSTGETVSAGHAINIYRYEDYIDESGKNCVKLFVYDSNFPGNDQLFIDIKPSEVKEDCFDYYYSGASFPWSSDNLAYQFTIFDDDCYYVTSPYIDMKKTEKYDPETDSIYYLSSLQDGIDTEITNTELQKAREKGKFTILSPD